MSPLVVPPSGVALEGSRTARTPDIISLKLGNNVIEEMIKCYNSKKPLQLSLGENPSLQYGTKTQQLSKSTTPFTHELFSSSNSNTQSDSSSPSSTSNTDDMLPKVPKKKYAMPGMFWEGDFSLLRLAPKPKLVPASSGRATVRDPAVAALQNSLASESAKKAGNTTKYIKDSAGLPGPGRRGPAGKTGTSSKLLPHNRSLSGDATRSMPPSPGLSGAGSPSLGPTSVPLSQQQLAQAKATRKPVVHLLALAPLTEVALRSLVPNSSNADLKQALQKVGDVNQSTARWELRRPFYKELDVWNFDYSSEKDRQKVIDNAVKQYDKMRLGVSEPEWDRLLPPAERGTGKCLSKLQAQIAQGSAARAPKANSQKPEGSSRDGSNGDDESGSSDKNPSASSKSEIPARPVARPQPAKAKKVSEKVEKPASEKLIKTKRWMSAKNATKQKTSPLKKDRPTGKQGKVLSAEYIHESDEDDDEDMSTAVTAAIPTATPTPKPATKPATKPTTKPTPKPATTPATKQTAKPVPKTMKRPREDEEETSDSSVPLSKKLKEDPPHRTSDASQASRTSSTAAPTINKAKDSSPQKSSPLSSPPTNASEFESSSGHISSSASPAHHNGKGRRSPIYKRHQKSSSVTSSVSSSGSHRALNPEVVDLARTYRSFYPKYEALYREVANSGGKRNLEREQDLLEMHERLRGIKEQIVSGVIYLEN